VRKLLLVLVFAVLAVFIWLAFFPVGQRPDRSFDASVASPAFTSRHPMVLFDEAHYNAHSLSHTYRPFAKLLANDGYSIRDNSAPFSDRSLAGANVLVIVNAAGGSNPKLFGFNLVPLRRGQREAPAFTASEIEAVRRWVAGGGSLLLVADHYPFGSASASLAAAFGITMHQGYAEVPEQGRSDEIHFSRANGLLSDSPITKGVGEVVSFTGQSLDVPAEAALLKLPAKSIEYVPPPPKFTPKPAGNAQGAAFDYGKGRVVVLGEAAMLTAQVSEGKKFGMNSAPGNKQFVLNVMRWLARKS
jgi:hypothetical protein